MKNLTTVFALLFTLVVSSFAYAHEFIIVPQNWDNYHANQKLPFSLVSSHARMYSEELQSEGSISAHYNNTPLKLTPNTVFNSWDGIATLKKGAAALLTAHRKGQIWSKTTQGWKQGDSSTLKGVLKTNKYEKFAKSILPVDGNTKGFDKKAGHLLEIIPIDNPLTASSGDSIRVKFMYNGSAFAPKQILATYQNFTDAENTYAYATEPDSDGTAIVKLSASGLWMIRIEHSIQVENAAFQNHIMRATLSFPVSR